MGLFTGGKLEKMRINMQRSFQHVRDDMNNMSDWIRFLHEEHKHLQENNTEIKQRIHIMEQTLKKMPTSPAEIKKIIDDHYHMASIRDRIDRLEKHIEQKQVQEELVPDTMLQRLNLIAEKIEQLSQRKQGTPLQQKIIKKVTKHSKDYVKNVLRSLIHKYERVSALQLREIVVDEQGLVSKSSFYRLAAELEQGADISVVHDGKEKVYFSKMPSQRVE